MPKRSSATQGQGAWARFKALAGVGLSQNVNLIAKVLEAVHKLPAEDTTAVLGSNRHHLQEGIDALWYQCMCGVELEVSLGKFEKWSAFRFQKR